MAGSRVPQASTGVSEENTGSAWREWEESRVRGGGGGSRPPPYLMFGKVLPERGTNLPKIHNSSVDSRVCVVISRAPGKPPFILVTTLNERSNHREHVIFRQCTRFCTAIEAHRFWLVLKGWLLKSARGWTPRQKRSITTRGCTSEIQK